MSDLLAPATRALDWLDAPAPPAAPERFDLVTFPEAFATPEDVIAVAKALGEARAPACLHIGLKSGRPAAVSHLMAADEVGELAGNLRGLLSSTNEDLNQFLKWASGQASHHRFNIGCVLAIDADLELRACLHPKVVASQYEVDALADRHMQESDRLTLITLEPRDRRFGTVTLQPLICSDALNLPTNRMKGPPIQAVSRHGGCFVDPPDHVDLVSVATCTPQPSGGAPGMIRRSWHRLFLDSFVAAAESPDCSRHHFAAFVLANYSKMNGGKGGGLSGIFMPTPPFFNMLDRHVSVSCFGKPDPKQASPEEETWANNGWSKPSQTVPERFSSLGFVAGLDPGTLAEGSAARVFDFTIHHLPREASRWGSSLPSIVEPAILVCAADDGGNMRLRARGENHG